MLMILVTTTERQVTFRGRFGCRMQEESERQKYLSNSSSHQFSVRFRKYLKLSLLGRTSLPLNRDKRHNMAGEASYN